MLTTSKINTTRSMVLSAGPCTDGSPRLSRNLRAARLITITLTAAAMIATPFTIIVVEDNWGTVRFVVCLLPLNCQHDKIHNCCCQANNNEIENGANDDSFSRCRRIFISLGTYILYPSVDYCNEHSKCCQR